MDMKTYIKRRCLQFFPKDNAPGKCIGTVVKRMEDTINWYLEVRLDL